MKEENYHAPRVDDVIDVRTVTHKEVTVGSGSSIFGNEIAYPLLSMQKVVLTFKGLHHRRAIRSEGCSLATRRG